jgi:hypothetical protein
MRWGRHPKPSTPPDLTSLPKHRHSVARTKVRLQGGHARPPLPNSPRLRPLALSGSRGCRAPRATIGDDCAKCAEGDRSDRDESPADDGRGREASPYDFHHLQSILRRDVRLSFGSSSKWCRSRMPLDRRKCCWDEYSWVAALPSASAHANRRAEQRTLSKTSLPP